MTVSPWRAVVVVPSPWRGVSDEVGGDVEHVPDGLVHQAVARALVAYHDWCAREPLSSLWTPGPTVRVESSRRGDLFLRDRVVVVASLSPVPVRGELRRLLGTGVDEPSWFG